MNLELIGILSPSIIAIAILVYTLFVNRETKSVGNVEKNEKKATTFESDSQYLMFLVDYFCKSAYNNKLIPYQKNNNQYAFINDEVFNEVVIETARQITQHLSQPYKDTMSYYVPNITDFTSELVYNTITRMVMELNKETIKKLSR
jgi:FtsZ-interacting cell division protein ZipA